MSEPTRLNGRRFEINEATVRKQWAEFCGTSEGQDALRSNPQGQYARFNLWLKQKGALGVFPLMLWKVLGAH